MISAVDRSKAGKQYGVALGVGLQVEIQWQAESLRRRCLKGDMKGVEGGSQRPGFSAEGRTIAEALRGNGLECLGSTWAGGTIGSECEEVTEVTGARPAEPVVFKGLCSTRHICGLCNPAHLT